MSKIDNPKPAGDDELVGQELPGASGQANKRLTPDQVSQWQLEREISHLEASGLEGKIRKATEGRAPTAAAEIQRDYATVDHARLDVNRLKGQAAGADQRLALHDIHTLLDRIPMRLDIGTTVYAPDASVRSGRDAGWEVEGVDDAAGRYRITSEVTGETRVVGREDLEVVQPDFLLVQKGKTIPVQRSSGEVDPGWEVVQVDEKKGIVNVQKDGEQNGKSVVLKKEIALKEALALVRKELEGGKEARGRFDASAEELADLEAEKQKIVAAIEAASAGKIGGQRARADERARALAGEPKPGSLEYMSALAAKIVDLEGRLVQFAGRAKGEKDRADIKRIERELAEAKYWTHRERAELMRQSPRYKAGDLVTIEHPTYGVQQWGVKEFVQAGEEFDPMKQDLYVVWASVEQPSGGRKTESMKVPREKLELWQVDYGVSGAALVSVGDTLPIETSPGKINSYTVESIDGGIAGIRSVRPGSKVEGLDTTNLENHARRALEETALAKTNMMRAQRELKAA